MLVGTRYAAAFVAVLTSLGVVSGCASGPGQEVVTAAEPPAPPAPPNTESRVDDTHHRDQIEFLTKFRRSEMEVGPPAPESLDQAIEYSTVVMLAEVESVVDDGAIDEDGDRDHLTSASIILEPIETIKGQLQPGLDKIPVGFAVLPTIDDPDPIGTLRSMLPVRGQGIWMLRWAATRPSPYGKLADPVEFERTRYVWTHRSTIFAQDAEGVGAPTAPGSSADAPPKSAANEARGYRKLSDLTRAIRSSRSQPQVPVANPSKVVG